jgi:hypothetical protein
VEYGLGYNMNLNETFSTKLFLGAVYNTLEMSIYVQVYDNDEAYTIYYIPQNIIVYSNESETDLELIMEKLISTDSSFESNLKLNEGAFMGSIQVLQKISSFLNKQSLSDKLGLMSTGKPPIFPKVFGSLSNYSGVIPVICFLKYFFFSF